MNITHDNDKKFPKSDPPTKKKEEKPLKLPKCVGCGKVPIVCTCETDDLIK